MHKLTFATLAAVVALAAPARAATEVTVENIGAVFNESLALPAEDTPGSGIGFEQFFEFTLPVTETVTLSVSDSAIGAQRIVGGLLSLNNWTSNAGVSPFQPLGSLIESSALANVIGGQEGTVAPDALHRRVVLRRSVGGERLLADPHCDRRHGYGGCDARAGDLGDASARVWRPRPGRPAVAQGPARRLRLRRLFAHLPAVSRDLRLERRFRHACGDEAGAGEIMPRLSMRAQILTNGLTCGLARPARVHGRHARANHPNCGSSLLIYNSFPPGATQRRRSDRPVLPPR